MTITVRETIHHGDYRSERIVTIDPTLDGLVDALTTSPYASHDAEWYRANRYVQQAHDDLSRTGHASFGWARYDVVPSYVDEAAFVLDAFEYELCAECGQDADRHVITPDMFGHAHAWCMDEPIDAEVTA